MTVSNNKSLDSKLPIERGEWRQFLTTSIMMIMTLYIYSILRGSKDTLIVSELGAELISTLKLWGVLPLAVLFMIVYTKLSSVFPRTTLYYILNWFFVGFFVVFCIVLYPNASVIHFDTTELQQKFFPLRYVLIMLGNWSYSLFYIMSELYGSVMLSLMFWQLANQITQVSQAQRFYPLFGFMGQIGLVVAGYLLQFFSASEGDDPKDWYITLQYITISIVCAGIIVTMGLWYLSNRIVDKDVINGASKKSSKKKPKLSLGESFKYILSSKYIGLITLLILCYGVSINLVEGVWKKEMNELFPDKKDYGAFMGQVQVYTGFATFIAMICGTYMLRLVSWATAASLTPLMILFTGAAFFVFIIFGYLFEGYISTLGITALTAAVMFGAAQNVLSKAVKYSFFDPTKEMAYIPLDEELKSKGKAAADVVGGRLGKSGGAIIQWAMLALIPGSTLISLAPSLAVIFLVIMAIWLFAVGALSKEFKLKREQQAQEEALLSKEA